MAEDSGTPPDTKLTRSKSRWAQEGRFLTGAPTRTASDRLPPGQHLTKDWPVLDLGVQPAIAREAWTLDVTGAVDNPIHWTWAAFTARPQDTFVSDMHCVTTWSRYDNRWEGLGTRALLDVVHPKESARFVVLHSSDGYTTNLPLEDFAAADALLAHSSGKARSGSRPSSSKRKTSRAFGKCAATTNAATPGRSSGIPMTERT